MSKTEHRTDSLISGTALVAKERWLLEKEEHRTNYSYQPLCMTWPGAVWGQYL
jgi:hypothetical protein